MKINHLKKIFVLSNKLFNQKITLSANTLSINQILLVRNMSGETAANIGLPLSSVLTELNKFADLSLAEKWDNVGLLIEPTQEVLVKKILLTNDLTETVMEESINKNINLIISYHPPIFNALKRITQASWKERIVAHCLENRIAVFSPHTSWDAVCGGVNDWLADAFASHILPGGSVSLTPANVSNDTALYIATIIGAPEVLDNISKEIKLSERRSLNGEEMSTAVCTKKEIQSLKSIEHISLGIVECGKTEKINSGMGRLLQVSELSLADCVNLIKKHTCLSHVRLACAHNKSEDSAVRTIALVAGSGASLLKGRKADLFVTGEMLHHDVLDANHNGTSVILTNHSDSERGFLNHVKPKLKNILKDKVIIEISTCDRDPLKTV